MAYARKKSIGQSPVDPSQLTLMAINGSAIQFGDGGDVVGTFSISSRQIPSTAVVVGLGYVNATPNTADWRMLPLVKIPTKGVIPAFSRVLRALVYMKIQNGGMMPSSNTVPNNKVSLDWYGIRRTIDTANVDYQYYATSQAWATFAGQTGTDLTPTKLASLDITQSIFDQANALANGTSMYLTPFDIKTEVQFQSDRNSDVWLMGWLNSNWGVASVAGGQRRIVMSKYAGSTEARAYLDILYVPPIVTHAAKVTAGRPIDLGNVLDINSTDPSQQVYTGFVDEGETGDAIKFFVRNSRTDRIAKRLIVEATRSFASRPTSQLNSDATLPSLKKLRSVDTYDLHQTAGVIDELTLRGRWKLQASSSTLYDVYFDAGFTGTYTLVASNKAFASDEVISTSSVKRIKVRAIKWGSGAAVAGDKWFFDTIGDTTDPSFAVDSYGMFALIPPTSGDPDIADTARSRRVKSSPTQMLRASTYTATVSGSPRSIVPLGDTQLANYQVGDKVTIFAGATSEEAEVLQVYLSGDALPTGTGQPTGDDASGDAIALTTTLSQNYTTSAFLTGGIFIAQLDNAEDVFVDAAGAAAGQNVIPISTPVGWTDGTAFGVISLATGQTQSLIKQTGGGASITATLPLNFALASGDFVVRDNTNNYKPFFVQSAIPLGALLGDRIGFLRIYEARSQTLQNVV
jgi:hypothetical protein